MNDRLNIDLDDSTLVEECRNGNRVAMGMLYTRFAPAMLRIIRKYVANADDAYDILHDGFIVAFTRIDSIKDSRKMGQWLGTIMRNLALKFIQQHPPEMAIDDCCLLEEEAETPVVIPDFAILEELISRLPTGYQKVFRLAILSNKSHKEISKILGIAPNSSSSQLVHAKRQLKKLINDYCYRNELWSALIIGVSASLLYLLNTGGQPTQHHSGEVAQKLDTKTEEQPESPVQPLAPTSQSPSVCSHKSGQSTIRRSTSAWPVPVDATAGITIPDLISQAVDTLAINDLTLEPSVTSPMDSLTFSTDLGNTQEDTYAELWQPQSHKSKWHSGLEVNPGLLSFNADNDLILAPGAVEDAIYSQHHDHSVPISVGISVECRINPWLGIESGIGYTYLHTTFEGRQANTDCQWHYLSLPLNINLYAFRYNRLSFYTTIGGSLYIPVYSGAKVKPTFGVPDYESGRLKAYPVWSIGGGIGMSYELTNNIELFVNPTLQYHFTNKDKVPNLWQDNPWSVACPIGIRFGW